MKKLLSLLLALTLVFALVACSNEKDTASESDTSTTQTEVENTDNTETTDSDSDTTDKSLSDTKTPSNSNTSSTQNNTTTNNKDNTTSSKPSNAINKPTISMPSTPPAKDTTTPTESTQTPTDEPDENPADEPSDCEHTYPTVTCTIPKMCTKCHHIAGNALPHNYKNGSCTVCGMAEMLVTFREGYWVAYTVKSGTSEQGEILSEYVLAPELDHFSGYMCFSNASACFLDKGKITYNDKAYHSDWYYTTYLECTYEENGDTITIKVGRETHYFEFVAAKTSETQLTVISSTNTAYVPVGIVFVKQ